MLHLNWSNEDRNRMTLSYGMKKIVFGTILISPKVMNFIPWRGRVWNNSFQLKWNELFHPPFYSFNPNIALQNLGTEEKEPIISRFVALILGNQLHAVEAKRTRSSWKWGNFI